MSHVGRYQRLKTQAAQAPQRPASAAPKPRVMSAEELSEALEGGTFKLRLGGKSGPPLLGVIIVRSDPNRPLAMEDKYAFETAADADASTQGYKLTSIASTPSLGTVVPGLMPEGMSPITVRPITVRPAASFSQFKM